MLKNIVLMLAILGIIALLVGLGYYLYETYYLPSTYTLSPPFTNVNFPPKQSQYPEDWPDELKFPKEFVLVDSSSGSLSENNPVGRALKLRFQGKPREAVKIVSDFFEGNGWEIIESNKLDSEGFSLLIKRNEGNGIVVIDTNPANSSETFILATIFPAEK